VPGRVAGRIDPAVVARLGRALPAGSVVVTATNGKTTTTRLIAQVLAAAGRRVVHNRSGANLLNGVASALVRAASPSGRVGGRGALGLFEVDEASLPEVAAALQPRVLAFGNLFRDQLDRYGEVTFVASSWRRALAGLPASSALVLNADDPSTAALGVEAGRRVLYIGLDDLGQSKPTLEHTADARLCPRCGARLAYEAVFYGHLGHYRCPGCGFARPRPHLSARSVEPAGFDGTRVDLGDGALSLPLPGLYNVYNALLALGVADLLGVDRAVAVSAIERGAGVFGRVERIAVGDRTVVMALVKNPVGFDQVLRTVLESSDAADLLIAINDRLADGTDVSWLWDVDFEALAGRARSVVVAGDRAEDMRVRLKYAGVDPAIVRSGGLDDALANVAPGGTLYLLPTYTAMLDLRAELARRGHVAPFWED
jgi:UDP-N-acetylmuramyl tripeptide synthase